MTIFKVGDRVLIGLVDHTIWTVSESQQIPGTPERFLWLERHIGSGVMKRGLAPESNLRHLPIRIGDLVRVGSGKRIWTVMEWVFVRNSDTAGFEGPALAWLQRADRADVHTTVHRDRLVAA